MAVQSEYDKNIKNLYLNKSKGNILVMVKGNFKRYESVCNGLTVHKIIMYPIIHGSLDSRNTVFLQPIVKENK